MKNKIPPAPKPTPVMKGGFPTMGYVETFFTFLFGVVVAATIVISVFAFLIDARLAGREQDRILALRGPAPLTGQEQAGADGLPYGIIDPDHAAFFTVARLVGWNYGYTIAINGSFKRDLDLIAVPWTENVREPEHVLKNIESRTGWKRLEDNGSEHPHGRRVWTLTSGKFECPRFVDLGFMPALSVAPQPPKETGE